jgi:hypothetical protein
MDYPTKEELLSEGWVWVEAIINLDGFPSGDVKLVDPNNDEVRALIGAQYLVEVSAPE